MKKIIFLDKAINKSLLLIIFFLNLCFGLTTNSFCMKQKREEFEQSFEQSEVEQGFDKKRRKEEELDLEEEGEDSDQESCDQEDGSSNIESDFFNLYCSSDKNEAKKKFMDFLGKKQDSSNIGFILKNKDISPELKLEIIKWLLTKEGCSYRLTEFDLDWKTIFKQDLEIIKFFANSKDYAQDPEKFSFDYDDFYGSFLQEDEKKDYSIIEIFTGKDVDWISLFNIYLLKKKFCKTTLECLYANVKKCVDDINSFNEFDNMDIDFQDCCYIAKDKPLGLSFLFMAILSKDLSKVKFLVEHCQVDVNACYIESKIYKEEPILNKEKLMKAPDELNGSWEGISPLHLACGIRGCQEIADYLIFLNEPNKNVVDSHSRTPFCISICSGNISSGLKLTGPGMNTIKCKNYCLLENSIKIILGAMKVLGDNAFKKIIEPNIDSLSESKNILHHLCRSGSDVRVMNAIGLFAKLVSDINLQDNNGNCPIHYACENKIFLAAKILIDRGARIDLKNKAGKTPIDILCEHKTIDFSLMNAIIRSGEKNKCGKILIPKAIILSENPAIKAFYECALCDEKYYTEENIVNKKNDEPSKYFI